MEKFAADETDMELKKLRPRGAASTSYQSHHSHQPMDDMVFLERDIYEGDTIQSFSILYNTTVNDLKRANNLMTEQDFYALKRIKIPVKKFGLLTEEAEERKRRQNLMTSSIKGGNVEDDLTREMSTPSPPPGEEGEPLLTDQDTSRFLKSVDKEIRKSTKQVTSHNPALEEVVTRSLGSVGYRPLAASRRHDDCNGSDWGCRARTVIVWAVVVLAFIALVLGYEFYKNNPHHEHDNDTSDPLHHHHGFEEAAEGDNRNLHPHFQHENDYKKS